MSTEPDTIILSEEQARTGTRLVTSHRVMLRRRVVTVRKTVEVTLRREELEVEEIALDGAPAASGAPAEPFVIVLREEFPEVTTRVRPYEQVQVSVEEVTGKQFVDKALRRENLEVEMLPGH